MSRLNPGHFTLHPRKITLHRRHFTVDARRKPTLPRKLIANHNYKEINNMDRNQPITTYRRDLLTR